MRTLLQGPTVSLFQRFHCNRRLCRTDSNVVVHNQFSVRSSKDKMVAMYIVVKRHTVTVTDGSYVVKRHTVTVTDVLRFAGLRGCSQHVCVTLNVIMMLTPAPPPPPSLNDNLSKQYWYKTFLHTKGCPAETPVHS